MLYRYHAIPHPPNPFAKAPRAKTSLVRPIAAGSDLLGEIGARDPFPEEIESNFCDNVLGNTDTLHRILIPNIAALSLAETKVEPLESFKQPLSAHDARRLLKKVSFFVRTTNSPH